MQWFWLVAVGLLGACVGSFLNVVIYRLARGMSVHTPARSFCPGCGKTIAWYDNIPIISYLLLMGRCRHCGMTISIRYPLIEAVTVLLFVLVYDTFFLSAARPAFTTMGADWPIFLAHLVLLAALIVTSAIDVEGYWIDVSITYTVAMVGIVAQTLWTPTSSAAFPRPWAGTSAGAFGAAIGLLLVALLFPRKHAAGQESDEDLDHPVSEPPATLNTPRGSNVATACILIAVILAWSGLVVIDADRLKDVAGFAIRAGLVLGTCFVTLVVVGMTPTQADADIMEAIDGERSTARREAGIELAWLLPAIILGVASWLATTHTDAGRDVWKAALSWAPLGGQWRPVWGAGTALAGFIVAGAIGWGVRIVFTLILGREAFGMGDVHLMAAASAVTSWPVVVIGFFLACPLAVVAVLIWLLRKRSRAVWFGPWLSLGIVVAMVSYEPIAERFATMLEVLGWLAGGGSH